MQKMKSLALLSAIALTGAVGFTACSSSDELEEVVNNPNYDPQTGEVTTNFVFNVSTSNSPSYTRMSAADTQADVTSSYDFRGITNADLLSFKLTSGTALTDGKSVPTAQTADKIYGFGTVIGAHKLDPVGGGAASGVDKSRRVLELSLPTETNALVCYGRAIKTGTDVEQGKITRNVEQNLNNVSFSLCKIIPDTPDPLSPLIYKDAFLQYENLIAKALTEIVRSKVPAGETFTYGGESITLSQDLKWSDFVTISADLQISPKTTAPITGTLAMCALGEILGNSFTTFNTIYANELRAGDGEAVSHMIKDLMVLVNNVVNATPVSMPEVVTQAVALEIKKNVERYFDDDQDYVWRETSVVKDTLTAVLTADKDKVADDTDLNEFPRFFNLPNGAVILEFLITRNAANNDYVFTYAYKGTVETYAMGGSTTATDAFDALNYMYPAELCYFGNSPVRVTNETKVPNDYPDGVSEWEKSSNWTGWTSGGHVLSTTRSVAMQYSVNYGTALLATTVRYGASALEDNNATIQYQRTGTTEANNVIDVSANDTHFLLTGVLVGGQEPEVGWNYLAKAATPGFGAMVYDNVGTISIPKATSEGGGEKSTPCYTLLWDNWQESLKGSKQRDVYVALEFKNNSAGFWGENNFIRNGATFYIVGKLDPNEGRDAADLSEGITWPANQALPPYNADGSTVKQRRVFIQDFVTTANFVIGPTSLQHALVSVPDLRSGQISLGLAVDLKWQTGLTFNNVVLGE